MATRFLAGFHEKLIGLVINQADTNKDYGYYQHPNKQIRHKIRENQSLKDRVNKQISNLNRLIRKKL
jgi:hypothetical protein